MRLRVDDKIIRRKMPLKMRLLFYWLDQKERFINWLNQIKDRGDRHGRQDK